MSDIQYQKDENNIVHLVLDKPNSPANLMDHDFAKSLNDAVNQLVSDDYIGVIIRSTKKTFFAGGDLNLLSQTNKENSTQLYKMTVTIKNALRELETLGKPVVACINGAAMGGGWEIALSAHHRIAINSPRVVVALPEVTLGLLPGAGGVIRSVRLLGIQEAMPLLMEGKKLTATAAHKKGLIHQLVDNEDSLISQATDWIKQNPEAAQPWDEKGYRMPGGPPSTPKVAGMLAIAPAMLRKKTGGNLPAPEKILAAIVEGAQVDFDTACQIETRLFIELACSPITKNLINTFWFGLNGIKSGMSRPQNIEKYTTQKVGVIGAGMMGAGIAYASAIKGIPVVLKDIVLQAAEKGKGYSDKILTQSLKYGKISEDRKSQVLGLIQPSDNSSDLKDCDLIIEAVFEDRDLKAKVTQEVEAQISKDAIFSSNTSTLPISGLAEASKNAEKYIGLHFFSPVDKMSLVEIIVGEKTSDETLARCYDYVLQIGKTPIVVNDSRGFYTSRVFTTFVYEGIAMLGEGIAAASIENAASLAGFPVGPLAISDEVSLTLFEKIRRQTTADCVASDESIPNHPADKVIDQMLELERRGKLTGAGFYQYPEGQKKSIWPGLVERFSVTDQSLALATIKQRLLYIMAIESIRCLEENVITSSQDGNVGSVFGIGYPAWTGGALQYVNHIGLNEFIKQANQLTESFGARFTPPKLLLSKAQNNQRF